MRALSSLEMDTYRDLFLDTSARRPMWRWSQEIPIEGTPADVTTLVTANQGVIADLGARKLLLHANPGAVIGPTEVVWCRDHGQALTIVDVGHGTHFLPEDRPDEIAAALCGWLDDSHRQAFVRFHEFRVISPILASERGSNTCSREIS
jgi:haloalkane dehalogenase